MRQPQERYVVHLVRLFQGATYISLCLMWLDVIYLAKLYEILKINPRRAYISQCFFHVHISVYGLDTNLPVVRLESIKKLRFILNESGP